MEKDTPDSGEPAVTDDVGNAVTANCAAAPAALGVKEFEMSGVSTGAVDVTVRVYGVPTTPLNEQFATVMTPATEERFEQPARLPFA